MKRKRKKRKGRKKEGKVCKVQSKVVERCLWNYNWGTTFSFLLDTNVSPFKSLSFFCSSSFSYSFSGSTFVSVLFPLLFNLILGDGVNSVRKRYAIKFKRKVKREKKKREVRPRVRSWTEGERERGKLYEVEVGSKLVVRINHFNSERFQPHGLNHNTFCITYSLLWPVSVTRKFL